MGQGGSVAKQRSGFIGLNSGLLHMFKLLVAVVLIIGGSYTCLPLAYGQGADQAVAGYYAEIRSQLAGLAGDDGVALLFDAGDTASLEQEAARRQAQFAAALKLRFLVPGAYAMDNSVSPPLGFASLDLLRRAESSNEAIDPEALMLGTSNAHVVFIERVKNQAGELTGLIHLSLNTDVLKNSLADVPVPDAYLELQQLIGERVQILASSGSADLKQGEPVYAEVTGTGWRLAFWGDAAPVSTEPGVESSGITTMALIIGGALVLLLLAGVGVFVFRRRRTSNSAADADPAANSGAGIVYAGAIRAIMDGAHPGMEKLIPNLETLKSGAVAIQPLSQGLVGDDITMIASAKDLKAKAASGDFFDLTGGDTPPSEAITEPNMSTAEKNPVGEAVPDAPEISPHIFRTYDIRGVVGKDLTPEIVNQLGLSIGSEAAARGEKQVAIGRDGRTSSPELAEALITGLRSAGRDVIDIGMVPTPVLYFATHVLDASSGVMLTGSHNGPTYNGLKIVLAGETLSEDAIKGLYQRIVDNNLESGKGNLETREITTDYIRRITEDIPVALGGAFKLVVDCGNGVAGTLAPQLYRALGHDVIELYCDVDGKFPNHHPDPSQPENLQALIDKVRTEQADLGFAFDGDADRLGVIDGLGNIIWPDRQLMILASDVLKRNPGAEIIYDVKCSKNLKTAIEAAGGKPLMWKTGHSLIKSKMKTINAPLAGEMSGHIFFKERWYGFDDALYTGARLLEVLMSAKAKPAEVFAKIPDAVATPELRVDLPESEHKGFMEELKDKIAFDGADVYDIDGFRIEFPDGWGLVRPSNTTPCLVLRFEADDKEALARIQAEFHQLLLAVKPDLTLPF